MLQWQSLGVCVWVSECMSVCWMYECRHFVASFWCSVECAGESSKGSSGSIRALERAVYSPCRCPPSPPDLSVLPRPNELRCGYTSKMSDSSSCRKWHAKNLAWYTNIFINSASHEPCPQPFFFYKMSALVCMEMRICIFINGFSSHPRSMKDSKKKKMVSNNK